MFHILIGVVITQVYYIDICIYTYMFDNAQHVVLLKSVHFADCKCARNLKGKTLWVVLMSHILLRRQATGTQEMKWQFAQVHCRNWEIYSIRWESQSFEKREDFHHDINCKPNTFVLSALEESKTKVKQCFPHSALFVRTFTFYRSNWQWAIAFSPRKAERKASQPGKSQWCHSVCSILRHRLCRESW